jgi:uncharacterized protein (DUF2235 family)
MKRLLVFFDGTWNTADAQGAVTNVVKLHRAVPERDPSGTRQAAHYIVGIATDKELGRLTFAAGAVGYGVAERIQAGLNWLAESYEPGDEIYLFGFSRGAFQARSLAGLVALCGIPRSVDDAAVAAVWDYYAAHRSQPDEVRLGELRAAAHCPVRIRLVGVWDTVGNLGVPFLKRGRIHRALAFHSTALSPTVDVGLHALSIDEPRGPFSPTLWTRHWQARPPDGQIIEQVWFPGCHADVGGGYARSGLSDISLLWMAERAMATTGVAFDMEKLRRETAPNPLAEQVSPTSEGIFRATPLIPYVRLIEQNIKGIRPWRRALLGTWRSNRLASDQETVNETIHASAVERYGKRVVVRRGNTLGTAIYRPRPLKLALARMRRREKRKT